MPTLYLGDCLDVMRGLPDNSVDAIVTDPPAGIAFMGKAWDHDKGGRRQWIAWLTEIATEMLRVLKPGGHAFVWALPRTSHWTATAMEDAGWEIRECCVHLFGSGFPKSLDVSKAIDKAAGAEREVIGQKKYAGGVYDAAKLDPGGPTMHEGWQRPWQSDPDHVARMRHLDTAPATDAARQWQGWGTALKPSSEHWWLCRKPLSEPTVAANVLRWGCGALAIDACRVAVTDGAVLGRNNKPGPNGWKNSSGGPNRATYDAAAAAGRWPPNTVLSCCGQAPHADWCAVGELDRQSGVSRSVRNRESDGRAHAHNKVYGDGRGWGRRDPENSYADAGTASRFFPCFKYQTKASRADRTMGGKVECTHPTVKPTALMEWLITLITPPGNSVVLDPFMGSGSTGVAALRLGHDFIGIEREPEYHAIAEKRLAAAEPAQLPLGVP